MSATKTTLTANEIELFSKMYEYQMLKASLDHGGGIEFDSHFENGDLTAYSFTQDGSDDDTESRITFLMYFKSWAGDECFPKISGQLSDGRYIEELTEKELKANKEYKSAFKKAYKSGLIKKIENLQIEYIKVFHPTLYTYAIYGERYITALCETFIPFQDIFHQTTSKRPPKMPTKCYTIKMLNTFLSEFEQ